MRPPTHASIALLPPALPHPTPASHRPTPVCRHRPTPASRLCPNSRPPAIALIPARPPLPAIAVLPHTHPPVIALLVASPPCNSSMGLVLVLLNISISICITNHKTFIILILYMPQEVTQINYYCLVSVSSTRCTVRIIKVNHCCLVSTI